MRRVLVVHGDLGHQRVERDRAGVIGDDQCRACGWDVLDPANLDPEPRPIQRAQQGKQDSVGELLVEPELVDLVVPGQPATQEIQRLLDLFVTVVSDDVPDELADELEHLVDGLVPPSRALVAAGFVVSRSGPSKASWSWSAGLAWLQRAWSDAHQLRWA